MYYKYGILLMASGKAEEAISYFQKALDINATHYRAQSKLAICLFDSGRLQEAAQRIQDCPQIDQNMLALHYKTAMLFCDQRQFARALRNLKVSLQQDDASDVYQNIELVLENLGLIDRTLSNWKRLSEIAETILPEKTRNNP